MEEDIGVKAPVTRLRRRLSVEQPEDVRSPGPATPKKRGGRLAAKPQLELIDENVLNTSSKRTTRRTSVKEIVEAEEKPVTPSRRSTRIKSNTSIVSETTQNFDSPRAKRAARRTSQVGSDSESSVTPVRQTRRTRKDSTSSFEKLEATLAGKPSQITEIIIEEENNSVKSDEIPVQEEISPNSSIRKSQRLKNKKDRMSTDNTSSKSDISSDNAINEKIDVSLDKSGSENAQAVIHATANKINISQPNIQEEHNKSTSLPIEKGKGKKSKSQNLNKSTSALDNPNSFESKRRRTKSWTITTQQQPNDSAFYSDNENIKKNLKKRTSKEFKGEPSHIGSGDNKSRTEEQIKSPLITIKDTNLSNLSLLKVSKDLNSSNKSMHSNDKLDVSRTVSPKNDEVNLAATKDFNESTEFTEKSNTSKMEFVVYFDDSDDSKDKNDNAVDKQLDTEDQCVPVIDKQLVERKGDENCNVVENNDNDCEPMDIDETMPTNISCVDYSSNKSSLEKSTNIDNVSKVEEQKSLHCTPLDNSNNKSLSKSKRKSSLSNNDAENKSTLILSQIKDLSSSEQNPTKSPKPPKGILSQSVDLAHDNKNKTLNKLNLSHDYSTSTPLQQKRIKQLGMQINSSIIDSSSLDNESVKKHNLSKKDMSQTYKISEQTSDDDSSSDNDKGSSKLIYQDADVASDDYESGDSRNDDELQYEKENEILEKGETLEDDDDISNDTDYEKDSFVVSSNEEDNELLSGSGDDLSMSDNELSMSKKSKQKYNARKEKQQKQASREMYESRHKINQSESKKPKKLKNRQQFESSSDSSDSDNEVVAPVKKNRHMRLDSTKEDEVDNSDLVETKKKRKSRSLSVSVDIENLNEEKEMSTLLNNTEKDDPLSVQMKIEPKTPFKGLNISTTQIIENIEEVQVDNNISPQKINETSDPLQATVQCDEDSSMSENSDIRNNYDSILNKLNESQHNKTINSYEMHQKKKSKQNLKAPIIDELNLTKTKSPKQNKSQNNDKTINAVSSDDSDELVINETNYEEAKDSNDVEEFIPLKRIPGKTNIQTGEDLEIVIDTEEAYNYTEENLNMSLNNRKSKKKKNNSMVSRKNNQSAMNATVIEGDDEASEDISKEIKKNKKKSQKTSETLSDSENQPLQDAVEQSCNISSNMSSAKKKKNRISVSEVEEADLTEKSINLSLNKTSAKKKKNRVSISEAELTDVTEKSADTSTYLGSAKKKKNRISISGVESTVDGTSEDIQIIVDTKGTYDETEDINMSLNSSKKKNRSSIASNKMDQSTMNVSTNEGDEDEGPQEIAYESTKNKKKSRKSSVTNSDMDNPSSQDLEIAIDTKGAYNYTEENPNMSLNNSKSKKKKNKATVIEGDDEASEDISKETKKNKKKSRKTLETLSDTENQPLQDAVEQSCNISSIMSSAKKKKNRISVSEVEEADLTEKSINLSLNKTSAKTRKNRVSISEAELTDVTEKSADTSTYLGSAKKKKNRISISGVEFTDITEQSTDMPVTSPKKKMDPVLISEPEQKDVAEKSINVSSNMNSAKKKKNRVSVSEPEPTESFPNDAVESLRTQSKKRKRKSSANDLVDDLNKNSTTNIESLACESKMKKIKISQNLFDDASAVAPVVEDYIHKKKNKKRKERDDDDGNTQSKILKGNSFDKVHVTRLPTSILNKLEDKPKKEVLESKRSALISTTQFVVEDTRKRRNKPSQFLEESVYLNDSYVEKKPKQNIKKPTVLPFTPTAVTSGSGFTTSFKINIIPHEVKFVAQTQNVVNFKNDYMYGKKIKRLGTYETYKKHRNAKLSKF